MPLRHAPKRQRRFPSARASAAPTDRSVETLDPITFEVLRHGFRAICDESSALLARVAYAPTITEGHDFSASLLTADGLRAATLSLDDLYLPKAARRRLAAEVHPLLLTRGVPGTHDVELGLAVLEGLARPGRTLMPRFDKASDDRLPTDRWTPMDGPFDVILFEGWCVGARPQAQAALRRPVNDLTNSSRYPRPSVSQTQVSLASLYMTTESIQMATIFP